MRSFDLIVDGKVKKCDTRVIKSPYDGSDVGQVAVAGEEEIEEATAAAVRAAEQMAALPRHARVKILRETAHKLLRHKDELGEIICDEAGKPITYAKLEAARAVATFNAAADLLTTRGDETIPVDCVPHGEGRTGIVQRVPLGAIVGISPFNFPLNLSGHKVAPAIAAGNAMVLKPASQTPMSGLLLGQTCS